MMTVLNGVLVVVDAVDQPGVGIRLMTERVEVRRAARIERARTGEVLARLPRRDARRQIHQRREVPPVQRQFLDRPLFDDGANLGRIGAEKRRRGDDGGRFLEPPDFERDINARTLIHLQDDAVAHPFFEAGNVDFDSVGAGSQERRGVAACANRSRMCPMSHG